MKKILIVEDDQIVANIYRNKFAVEGYQVDIAPDGEAGLEKVQSFRPDAIVLDLMLPRLSGVEVMKRIRAQADLQKLPVIVFSNTYLTNLVQEAWKAGATKCLSKANCTPKQVVDVVRAALGNNGATAAPPSAAVPAPPTPPVKPTPAPTPVAAPGDSDAAFQADLRRSFVNGLPAHLATLRAQLKGLIKAEDETSRLKLLQELYRRIHALTGNAGVAGMPQIARLSDALEALLKELHEKPKHLNASTLRTIASAVDCLAVLFEDRRPVARADNQPPTVLVVDDEAISRRAVVYALDKAKLKSVNVENPATALDLLSETPFDLVILDVDMPGMSGFELCSTLRQLPAHKKTPVVFVTALNDFESRTSSTMSGGSDFIGKPFLFIELAVKALVYILRGRHQATK